MIIIHIISMGNMACTRVNNIASRPVSKPDKKYIVLQGNIGAGKSTLFNELSKRFENNTSVCMLPEPVAAWMDIKDDKGTILEHYYGDQKKYAFTFQMMAYISRLSILRDAMRGNAQVIISERSLDTDRSVFAAMLHDTGMIEEIEYQIYMKWFDEFTRDFPKETTIYVRTDPKIAEQRVIGRNREGETIPLEYLEQCHTYHEKWLEPDKPRDNLIILDGNLDVKKDVAVMNKWIMMVCDACFV